MDVSLFVASPDGFADFTYGIIGNWRRASVVCWWFFFCFVHFIWRPKNLTKIILLNDGEQTHIWPRHCGWFDSFFANDGVEKKNRINEVKTFRWTQFQSVSAIFLVIYFQMKSFFLCINFTSFHWISRWWSIALLSFQKRSGQIVFDSFFPDSNVGFRVIIIRFVPYVEKCDCMYAWGQQHLRNRIIKV